MDYDKLISRKKYRVRLPSSEVFDRIEKLLCPSELVPRCKEWGVRSKTRFLSSVRNPMWDFITSKMKYPYPDEELEKLRKEFLKDLDKHSTDT